MTYGRSLKRHLKRFSLPLAYTEWAGIAQNRVDWHKRVTKPPFTIGKPFLRHPRGDSRRTAEQKRCLLYTSPSPRDKRQSRMPSSA